MQDNYQEEKRYKVAQKKVKDIKGFYVHLVVYLFINATILIFNTQKTAFGNGSVAISDFYPAFFWGIGLFAHWASVFGANLFLGKKWEERKIRELMEKEQEEKRKWE